MTFSSVVRERLTALLGLLHTASSTPKGFTLVTGSELAGNRLTAGEVYYRGQHPGRR